MKQPILNEIPSEQAINHILEGTAGLILTMSHGQWDELLAAGYDQGAILLELDKNETPVRVYRKNLDL